jgi:hypothetical protein
VVTQPGAPVNGQDGRARRRGVGPGYGGEAVPAPGWSS